MIQKGKIKPKKNSFKADKGKICETCPAPCCRNLAMMITKPMNKTEIEELKWYLHFDTVSIFIRNYKWYLLIKGKCIYLSRDNLCKIYDRRPARCRRHEPPDCERFGKYYNISISIPEELEEYLKRKKTRK